MTLELLSPEDVIKLLKVGDINKVRVSKISPNFTWGEVLTNRTDKTVYDFFRLTHAKNASMLAQKLQDVRSFFGGRGIVITSWWRDPASNFKVGGTKGSLHLSGQAADITVNGLSPKEVQSKLESFWVFGGMGYGSTFTHLDIRGRKARFSY